MNRELRSPVVQATNIESPDEILKGFQVEESASDTENDFEILRDSFEIVQHLCRDLSSNFMKAPSWSEINLKCFCLRNFPSFDT